MIEAKETREATETMIRIGRSTAELLRALGKKGESYDDVIVQQILTKAQINVPVPPEVYGFLLDIAHVASTPTKVVDVSSVLGKTVAKIGAVSGFRGENFRDWGVQETAKATMITFFNIDNPYTLLSAIVNSVMETLIEEFGAYELEPVLSQALEAVAAAFARLFPEEEEEDEG